MQPVVIKRYANRKLYIAKGSTEPVGYVSLPRIIEIVRSGKSVNIVDNETGEDLTERVLKAALEYVPLNPSKLESLIRDL